MVYVRMTRLLCQLARNMLSKYISRCDEDHVTKGGFPEAITAVVVFLLPMAPLTGQENQAECCTTALRQ